MYPSEYLSKLWKRISYPVKITFASSMALGLIVHLFMITNVLPNHDTVAMYDTLHWPIIQGRWFEFIPALLNDGYVMPWVNGLLALFYIAISACIVIKCLQIKNSLHCVLISGLMVSFPTVTCVLTYIIHSNSLIFPLLLACLAVYITLRFRYGFCIGWAFITMSLGVYQAYISVAASLAVGVLIIDILQANLPLKKILIKGIKLFSIFLFGLIAYFVIVKITLNIFHIELTTYQGFDNMGKIPISMIPHLIKKAYIGIFNFFIFDDYRLVKYHIPFLKQLFYVMMVISALIFLEIVIQKKLLQQKKVHFFLLVILVILYPLACSLVYLMNASIVYLNMLYGMVLLPIASIVLMEIAHDNVSNKKNVFLLTFNRAACWIISIVLVIYIYNYGILANKAYIKSHLAYEQSYAFSIELARRIESVVQSDKDTPILLVGRPAQPINQIPVFNELAGLYLGADFLPGSYNYAFFMQNFLGFRYNLKYCDSNDIEKYEIGKTLLKMPLYPEQGSIKKVNNVVIVKFSSPPLLSAKNLIPDSGLPMPNSSEMVIQYSYDIFDLDIIDNGNVVLVSGNTDPQLYISLQYAIEKPSGALFMEITYTNTIPGNLQIFYDYGYGLSEENSTVLLIDAQLEEKTIYLPIEPWLEREQLVGFRLDPPNGTEFTIMNLKFLFFE